MKGFAVTENPLDVIRTAIRIVPSNEKTLGRGAEYAIEIYSEKKFRKDMFKSKRKSTEEIWTGPQIKGVSDISRFAPSACNSQPWRIHNEDGMLTVSRYLKPAKIGIMSVGAARYFNCIDMGIYLRFLELCLEHEGYGFNRELFVDSGSEAVNTIVAKYSVNHIFSAKEN